MAFKDLNQPEQIKHVGRDKEILADPRARHSLQEIDVASVTSPFYIRPLALDCALRVPPLREVLATGS